jgi:glycosyltransferase involved in cell wall biosynthesis
LAGLAEGLGLAQQVTFAGSLPREKVFEMLARSDVFVLPSYREAFGIAWLEGMAAGLVTIAVRDEGPSAFIESGRNGFLVESRNPEELAILLRGIFESPEQMRIIGAAAKETVRSSFTWDAHADKLLSCYSELLEQDRSPIASRPRLEAVH